MPTNRPEAIVLTHGGNRIAIPPDHVYFAFGDGRFAYDCVTCGARCCRGHGFEPLVDRDLQRQLAGRRALRFFLDPCAAGAGNHYHARNFEPACFFLTEQRLCSLHVDHGPDGKPETCRLFPFNQFTRAGDFLIVTPHSLCPLEIVAADARSPLSRHDELRSTMAAIGIATHFRESPIAGGGVAALVALERRIVALCEEQLHAPRYLENAAEQLALTRLAAGAADSPEAVRERARRELDAFLAQLYAVLDEPPRADVDDPAVARSLIAMTPSVRAQLLFVQGVAAAPGELERVPYFLLALHALVGFARDAGMPAISCQTVKEVYDAYTPLLRLLVNVDRVVAWLAGADADLAVTGNAALQASYLAVAKALLPSVQRRSPTKLGDVLRRHAAGDGLDRIVLLKLLARRMDGRLVPLDRAEENSGWLRNPRARAKQWAVGHLGEDALLRLATRRDRGRR